MATFGAIGESAMDFFRQLGCRIQTMTAETCSFAFLMQHLSVVIQRGNAVCIAGTAPSSGDLDMNIKFNGFHVLFLCTGPPSLIRHNPFSENMAD